MLCTMVPTGPGISGFPENVRKTDWSGKLQEKTFQNKSGNHAIYFTLQVVLCCIGQNLGLHPDSAAAKTVSKGPT